MGGLDPLPMFNVTATNVRSSGARDRPGCKKGSQLQGPLQENLNWRYRPGAVTRASLPIRRKADVRGLHCLVRGGIEIFNG